MSRRVNEPVLVDCNTEGEPCAVRFAVSTHSFKVLVRLSHWREWIGVLDGEPERDVWMVQLPQGICELHCLRYPLTEPPSPENWLLYRWED